MTSAAIPDSEAYVEAVLRAVELIPAGRVATYGDLAAAVGRGGPRQVGAVMSRFGGTVPWWRVVRADGQPARGHEERALGLLRAEGAPVVGSRVALTEARWSPFEDGPKGGSIRPARELLSGFTTGVPV